MANNSNLIVAQKNKDDEFYTQYNDIVKELSHYSKYFKDKTVYCNCDNPYSSNFTRYFIKNFHNLGLKRLICTGYNKLSSGYILDVVRKLVPIDVFYKSGIKLNEFIEVNTKYLSGNGDFKSYECISYLKESDIVVTNPPFSKFIDYFELLMKYNKELILITLIIHLGYPVVLPYISTGQVKISNFSNIKSISFVRPPPEQTLKKFGNARWITSLNIDSGKIVPLCKFDRNKYQSYDGYPDIINVNRLSEIPDYNGIIGVPMSYLDYHNPDLFEIIDFLRTDLCIKNKNIFARLLIRRRDAGNADGISQNSQNSVMNWEDYQVNDLNTDVQTNLSNWV